MSAREAAVRAAALKAVNDLASAAYKSAKQAAFAHLDRGDRKLAVMDDGTEIGTVYVTKGKTVPIVADERAFLDWVKANRPDEVVEAVRPSYIEHVLKRCKEADAPVDPKTGEVIPGIKVNHEDPYVGVTQTDEQASAVAAAHSAGALTALLRGTPVGELGGGA